MEREGRLEKSSLRGSTPRAFAKFKKSIQLLPVHHILPHYRYSFSTKGFGSSKKMKDQSGTKDPISPFVEVMSSPVEIDLDSEVEEESTPLRPIFCLKKRGDIKVIEEREECFILDFDPENDTLDDPSTISPFKDCDSGDSPDIKVIAEKGQVACRDYPHSRHLCVKHPFENTSHESYCKLCYCYVCDIAAPCKKWDGSEGHCHAIDNEGWKHVRKVTRQIGVL